MKYGNEKINIFDRLIIELDLSNRAFNALNRNGIRTIGDLVQKKEEDIFRIQGLGEKTATEIIDVIKGLNISGVHFGMTEFDVLSYGMTEEEKNKFEEEYIIKKEEERVSADNRYKLFNMKLSELGIDDPIVIITNGSCTPLEKRIIHPCILKDLLLGKYCNIYCGEYYENSSELIEGVNRLNIPGLYIGISEKNLNRLYISNVMMEYINEVCRNVILKRELYSMQNIPILHRENLMLQNELINRVHLSELEKDIKLLKERLGILIALLKNDDVHLEEVRKLGDELSSILKQIEETSSLNKGLCRIKK